MAAPHPVTVAAAVGQPRERSSTRNQVWNACVATVPTRSTIDRHRSLASSSSPHVCGSIPTDTASTRAS